MRDVLPNERLSRLLQLEHFHFWFVGRRALIARLLDRHLKDKSRLILDLGCGVGAMLEMLTQQGHLVVGLDIRPECLHFVRERLRSASVLQAEASHLPLKDNSLGAVMLLDVLEHLNDEAALMEVRRVLEPRGMVVITVPAMPGLWSYRDRAAGHIRRYTHSQLSSLLVNSEFRVQEMRYYQFLLFPLVWISRPKKYFVASDSLSLS